MIDLKKQTDSRFNKNKKTATATNTERSARKFLCVVLSLIIIFICITCIGISRKNKSISETSQASKTTTKLPTQEPSKVTTTTPENKNNTNTYPPKDIILPQQGTIDNPAIITANKNKPHLIFINSRYRLSEEYSPDLIYICDSTERLEKEAAQKYEDMYNAALKDGFTLTPYSGYRSHEEQEIKHNKKTDFFKSQGYTQDEAEQEATKTVMPAGSSEHNTGYAIDIICEEESFATTEEFKWLESNATDYGFIMRYPKDKQNITNFRYEPYHWRYVGVEAAQQIKADNITLEEYLGVSQ